MIERVLLPAPAAALSGVAEEEVVRVLQHSVQDQASVTDLLRHSRQSTTVALGRTPHRTGGELGVVWSDRERELLDSRPLDMYFSQLKAHARDVLADSVRQFRLGPQRPVERVDGPTGVRREVGVRRGDGEARMPRAVGDIEGGDSSQE